MGTRGFVGLIIRGKRHANFTPWDGYPNGLGKGIVDFILSLNPAEVAEMVTLLEQINVSCANLFEDRAH